jgi:hypothetical protein
MKAWASPARNAVEASARQPDLHVDMGRLRVARFQSLLSLFEFFAPLRPCVTAEGHRSVADDQYDSSRHALAAARDMM